MKGKNILIAVGGVPLMPEVPGIEHAISSDGFFDLEEQPKKAAVIGAGHPTRSSCALLVCVFTVSLCSTIRFVLVPVCE